MRILIAIASLILGTALLAGFVLRSEQSPHVAQFAEPRLAAAEAKSQPAAAGSAHQASASKVKVEMVPEAVSQAIIINGSEKNFQAVVLAPVPLRVTQPADARARRVLIMALQGELRRVGCYKGSVNGSWQASSKAALYWFMKRSNARLPVNEPDYVQLNLLKAAAKDACVDKTPQTDFVTQVRKATDAPVAGQTMNRNGPFEAQPADSTFAAARQRAGLPADGRVMAEGGVVAEADLPDPMAVGRVEPKKRRSSYRIRNRRVEMLFKHPLGRF